MADGDAPFAANRHLSPAVAEDGVPHLRQLLADLLRLVVLASLSPAPYSWLCLLAGMSKLSYRLLAVACALRIPKLLTYYALVRLGWLGAS